MKIRNRKFMKMVKKNSIFEIRIFLIFHPILLPPYFPFFPIRHSTIMVFKLVCVCVLVFIEIYMGEKFSFTVRRRKTRIGNLHSGKSSNLLNYIEKCLKFPFKGAKSLQIVDISNFHKTLLTYPS